MKNPKIPVPALVALAAVAPFFASCASSPTDTLSKNLANGTLTGEEAIEAIEYGADVQNSALLEKAAKAHRADLVKIFVENGANVWRSPSAARGKTFTLFTYIVDEWPNRELFSLCLAHRADAPAIADPLIYAFAERQRDAFVDVMYDNPKKADAYGALLQEIADCGVFDALKAKKYSPKEIRTDALRELVCGDGFEGYLAHIETLLKSGADANAKAFDGESSLLFFATVNEYPNTIKALTAAGAKLADGEAEKLREIYTENLRELICSHRVHRVTAKDDVEKILKKGADANAKTSDGRSLLFYARENKLPQEVIAALVAAGAQITDAEAAILRERATKRLCDLFTTEKEPFPSAIAVLLDAGADVNAKTADGNSLLFVAKKNDWDETAGTLEESGAKLADGEAEKLRGIYTERLCAEICEDGVPAIAEVENLLAKNADANAKAPNGDSLLFFTAKRLQESDEKDRAVYAKIGALLAGAGAKLADGEAEKLREIYTNALRELICANAVPAKDEVQNLLTAGADANTKTENGDSLLFFAISNGRPTEIADALKNAGAKLSDAEREKVSAQKTAALFDFVEKTDFAGTLSDAQRARLTRLIADGADVNALNDAGAPILLIALRDEDAPEALFEFLITDAGANVNVQTADGTHLLVAALTPVELESLDGLKIVVKAGADVNAKTKDGKSLLLFALEGGWHNRVIKVLTDAGAVAAEGEAEKIAAAKAARKTAATEKLRELICTEDESVPSPWKIQNQLENDADAKALTDDEETLLFVIDKKLLALESSYGNDVITKRARWQKIREMLADAGTELLPEEVEYLRRQEFFKAVRERNWNKITAFKNEGFNLASEDNDGRNAFHYFAMSSGRSTVDESVVSAFKNAGTDINKKFTCEDGTSFTPLSLAIESGNLRTVKLYLKHGADAKAKITIAGKMGNFPQSLSEYSLDLFNTRDSRSDDRKKITALIARAANAKLTEEDYE